MAICTHEETINLKGFMFDWRICTECGELATRI